MSLMRRARWPTVTTESPSMAPAPPRVPEEITYKGYRIEPGSYGVNTATWSPRAVISVKIDEIWSRMAPLYATNTARFPTRDEADRCALDVARAWIDRTVAQQGH